MDTPSLAGVRLAKTELGGSEVTTNRHGVTARSGSQGATVMSMDEGKLQQLLRSRGSARARLLANLAWQTAPATDRPDRGDT